MLKSLAVNLDRKNANVNIAEQIVRTLIREMGPEAFCLGLTNAFIGGTGILQEMDFEDVITDKDMGKITKHLLALQDIAVDLERR